MPTTVTHPNLTGFDAIHEPMFVQSSDPGAVGANKFWLDTTGGASLETGAVLKQRNALDTLWTARATLGTGAAAALSTSSALGASDTTVVSQKAIRDAINAAVAGLKWKQSVKVATTVAGTLASSFENGDTVDGIVLVTGDRILIKDQASGDENGIYVVAASGAPARATDADAGAELVSAAVFVEQGTANADKAFVCTNDAITLGVTAIAFTAFLAGGSGDVAGASASTDSELPLFSGTTGKALKRSNTLTGIPRLTAGVVAIDPLVPAWVQDASEDGSSFANFTAAAGTWASSGGIIQQTDTASAVRRAKHNTKFLIGLPLIIEVEVKIVSIGAGGTYHAGLQIGFDGSSAGSLSAYIERGAGKVSIDADSTTALGNWSTTINLDTWYKLRVLAIGHLATLLLDGTIMGTAKLDGFLVSGTNTGDFVGLHSYSCSARWRNFKLWTLSGGLPA